ncbi:MAG: efflux RND transporter periplasmic adaptor subunit [Bacteroidota bacterium]
MRLFSFALLGAALGLAACNAAPDDGADAASEAETAADRARPVEVVVADPTLFEDTIELTGTVDARNDALLSPDVPGTLSFVAEVGTFVRAGQTIAQVRATAQQAGVSQARATVATSEAGIAQAEAALQAARAQRQAAQAQLDLAQDQYRRQFPLFRDSILSALEFRGVESQLANARAGVAQADAGIAQAQGQLRAARAQVSAAAAGVRSAQTALANTRIVAPFSGIVEQRIQEPGELASPGAPVVRLVGSGNVKVTAGVPERYAGEIEQGTQVRVVPNAYAAEARGGRVTFAGAAIDTRSRTFPIEVSVENADRSLKPSMVVRLDVTRDVLDDVIVLPTEAVVRDERGTSVFVVAQDSSGAVAARRVVDLGANAGETVVVQSGVEAGDRVIVSGAGDLAEGDLVRITETRPLAALAEE